MIVTMTKTPISAAKPFAIRPSTRGLENIQFKEHDEEFEFRIGDGSYSCSWMIAEFLSPRIAKLRRSDPTMKSIQLTSVNDDGCGRFGDVLSLGSGSDLVVESSNREFFVAVFQELENSELCFLMEASESELTTTNVIDRMKTKIAMNLDILNELKFIASHFHEFSIDSFEQLGYEELYEILSLEDLLISSEDSLFELISRCAETDSRYFAYFEFVRFEFLSTLSVSKFVDLTTTKTSSHEFLTSLNDGIWQSICRRLVRSTSEVGRNNRVAKPRGREFAVQTSSPFSGIISHLTSEYDGNVCDAGIVDVIASSICNSHVPKQALDLSTDTCFSSENRPNQWLCYDFKELRIVPSGYAIRSGAKGWCTPCYLRSWVIETSMDGKTWNMIDRRGNIGSLTGAAIQSFSIPNGEECRMIRLRQTGKSDFNYDHLTVVSWEIFGTLLDGE
jgi:hypothetical protein